MRRNTATTIRTVDLGYDQMLVLEDRPGARVQVLYGGVWLTEEGQPDDVFARSGQVIALRSRKRALLEGLGPTRIEVVEQRDNGPWRTLVAAARRIAQRLLNTVGSTALRSSAATRGTLATAAVIVGFAVTAFVVLGMTGTPLAAALIA